MGRVRHSERARKGQLLFFSPWGVWRGTGWAGLWAEVPAQLYSPSCQSCSLQPTRWAFRGLSKNGPAPKWSFPLAYCLGLNSYLRREFFHIKGTFAGWKVTYTTPQSSQSNHKQVISSDHPSIPIIVTTPLQQIRRERFTEVKWLAQGHWVPKLGTESTFPNLQVSSLPSSPVIYCLVCFSCTHDPYFHLEQTFTDVGAVLMIFFTRLTGLVSEDGPQSSLGKGRAGLQEMPWRFCYTQADFTTAFSTSPWKLLIPAILQTTFYFWLKCRLNCFS